MLACCTCTNFFAAAATLRSALMDYRGGETRHSHAKNSLPLCLLTPPRAQGPACRKHNDSCNTEEA